MTLQAALQHLYATFRPYRIGEDFAGCECCVGPEHSARLAAGPLCDLSFADLKLYSRKAMTTWGDAHHFKHFLPRLLELAIDHRDDFLDLEVVFGKIAYARFSTWPRPEQDAVQRFFDQYWCYQLAEPIVGVFEDSIDTALCAISNAVPSVQNFLDTWLADESKSAKLHLAAFILNNDDSLLKKGRLSNAFWDTGARAHGEVLAWLKSEAVLHYLKADHTQVLVDDFAFALPQLLAVRAALAND